MERQMLNVELSDKNRNEWARRVTKGKDVFSQSAKLK